MTYTSFDLSAKTWNNALVRIIAEFIYTWNDCIHFLGLWAL